MNPFIEDGIAQLRTRWPQSHYQPSNHGDALILVPSLKLPKGYDVDICTVLFVAPAGFPSACPSHFFTDIPIRLANGASPTYTRRFVPATEAFIKRDLVVFDRHDDWPAWRQCMRWFWKLQAWNPNTCTLMTYMNVIRTRFNLVA